MTIMNPSNGFFVRLAFRLSLLVTVMLGFSGCVTTTTIDEGDGIILQEEPPPSDQVEVDR